MRNFIVSIVILFVLIVMMGCGTKSSYIQTSGTKIVNVAEGFTVGRVEDQSIFYFGPHDSDAFIIDETMKAELEAQLVKYKLIGNGYKIDVNILDYSPGNAFARWILPGLGATRLAVEALIKDKEGVVLAKIPVNRHISAGGAFTIGAYKRIFTDVAQEIVDVIKKQK
ncbi:MAG: DUF4410 domain-containing protein [Campylobacteraceae bacterium]|nr:DUF4410 domain-containing protein [Campylobacteraceae bacterium]